jgi:excisionase family DNA binding protein
MKNLRKPTKSDQQIATKSYQSINNVIDRISSSNIEIEIEESHEKIILPKMAVELLGEILKSMSEGIPISIVPEATEVTTQKAAEIIGCSRPHLVKLLETGEIEFIKVGKHRRINIEDVYKYKLKMKEIQKQRIIEMMNFDEEIGLYDI